MRSRSHLGSFGESLLGRSVVVVPCKNTILGCRRKIMIPRKGNINTDDHSFNCPYNTTIAPNTFGKCKLLFC